MALGAQVFVSSSCYELRDLRAALRVWLTERGFIPQMSDEGGFPHTDGMPPYVSCLPVLEQCPLVIGVIDRGYGAKFDDWGSYRQFKGCSPTHAELRHAFDLKKRVLIYIHDDVWNFYEVWRKNKTAFDTAAPNGLSLSTLHMILEFKKRTPIPWMEHFSNVATLQDSLANEFSNQIHAFLVDNEKLANDAAGFIMEKITKASPDVRKKIVESILALGRSAGVLTLSASVAIEQATKIEKSKSKSEAARNVIEQTVLGAIASVIASLLAGTGGNFVHELLRLLMYIK